MSKYAVLPRINSGEGRGAGEGRPNEGRTSAEGAEAPPGELSGVNKPVADILRIPQKVPDILQSNDAIRPKSILKREKTKDLGASDSVSTNSAAQSITPESNFEILSRKIDLPLEPNDNETRLLLAIRLPTGSRLQRYFRPSENLQTVVEFAEKTTGLDFAACQLVCDAPRAVFNNRDVSIESSGLENRTVLHLRPSG